MREILPDAKIGVLKLGTISKDSFLGFEGCKLHNNRPTLVLRVAAKTVGTLDILGFDSYFEVVPAKPSNTLLRLRIRFGWLVIRYAVKQQVVPSGTILRIIQSSLQYRDWVAVWEVAAAMASRSVWSVSTLL
ncbi:hypothetical protein HPB48_010207 [Haemaphysalis longicornis]|uniref:Uncharacterized protein n=1 Tax=Haemaphysalis longicornis TaxID=44386 RepID=A0A9J6H5P3_HAELO|nr:hypothetical protein HPB48_010207 [Haemaphysalis longicornis]